MDTLERKKKFGRWLVLRLAGRDKHGDRLADCRCKCGSTARLRFSSIRSGNSKSCGCLNRELSATRAKQLFSSHGHCPRTTASPSYFSWAAMTQRCTNPKHTNYRSYGAKGVKVCKRWRVFANFLADMGDRPKGTTLGRFLDTGNYEKSNCAWMSKRQQRAESRKKRRVQ